MDPTAQPNLAPNQNSTESSGGKQHLIVYVLLVVLAAALGVGGYFLGTNTQGEPSSVPVDTRVETLPIGYTAAQNLIRDGGSLVTRSSTLITYEGTLTGVDPDRTWTLEGDGNTVTLRQEATRVVKYYLTSGENANPQLVDASALKIGDVVAIITFVDQATGVSAVDSINVIQQSSPEPAAQEGQEASPPEAESL